MAKIFKLIINIIFIIIIALLLTYLLLRTTDKIEIYRVKTGSMEEKIHVGDYIMIYQKSNYNVGEIVTYTSNDGFITHRIIKKEGNKIITKGDANNTEDREILASTIVGKTILIGGILNIVINYKYVIVCVLISLYLFSCYFKKKEKDKNKKEIENDEVKEITDKTITKKEVETKEIEHEEQIVKVEETKVTNDVEDAKKDESEATVGYDEEIKKETAKKNEETLLKKKQK